MTREEEKDKILHQYPHSPYHHYFILLAMDEYAKQIAVEFDKWKLENGCENGANGSWVLEFDPISETIDPKAYTIEQLYSLWEQTKKK